jgi:sporulation protein YlmC with PRC-barrel domain
MTMRKEYCLVRDLLDKQMVDREKRHIGRIDGIVLHVARGKQPRVTHIESGALILARRLGTRWERFVAFMTRHFGVRNEPVFRVPWKLVTKAGIDVHIDVDGTASDASAWEHWLDDHLIGRLPLAHEHIKEE